MLEEKSVTARTDNSPPHLGGSLSCLADWTRIFRHPKIPN